MTSTPPATPLPAPAGGRAAVATDGGDGGYVSVGSVDRPATCLAVAVVVVLLAEVMARGVTAGTPPPLRFHDHAAQLRAEMMEAQGTAEVVFAGTSMTWQAMVPPVFSSVDPAGRSAFNAGLDGAVPVVTGPWLRDHVVPTLSPRTVVWGLSSLDLAPAYGQQQRDAWHRSPEGRSGPLGVVERWAADVSTLVARRPHLRRPSAVTGDPAAQVARARADAQRATGSAGQRIGLTGQQTPEGAAVQRARLAGFAPDEDDLHAIAETVLTLSDAGVEVVLVELPISPSFAALHPRGPADVALARQAMAALAQVLDLRFLPASPGWHDADFVDFTHLTAQAAHRFTTDVAIKLGAPPDDLLTRNDGDGQDRMADDVAAHGDPTSSLVGSAATDAAVPVVSTPGQPTRPPPPAAPTAPPSAASSAPPASGPATASEASAAQPPPAAPAAPAGGGEATGPSPASPAAAAPPDGPAVTTDQWIADPASDAVAEVFRYASVAQVGCAGEVTPPEVADAARTGAAQLADRGLADAVVGLLDRSAEVVATCDHQSGWMSSMAAVLQAAEDVARRLEDHAGVPQTPQGAVTAASTGATARDLAMFASHAHDRLHWLLKGAGHRRLSRNPVWWSYAQRGHVDALLRAADRGERYETVVLGTSQARTAILPERLAQATGQTVFNAGVDGGTVDVAEAWARDFVLDAAAPSRVVVMVSGVDTLTSVGPPCPSGALNGLRSSLATASSSFSTVPWLQATTPLRLASGSDTTSPPPLPSPLVDGYAAGLSEDYRARSHEEAMHQGRPYLAAYESFTFCPDRFDALQRLVQEMVQRDIEVVVVAAPIRSELREVARPGAIDQLDRRVQQVTEQAGGRFVSYTTLMADADMVDLIHVSHAGAQLLTDQLAADLGAG